MDFDKAATAAHVMPWHAPPGLGIYTSALNFADLKIAGSLSDGICMAVRHTRIPVIALEWDIAIARLQSVIGNSRETKGGKAYQGGL